MRKAPRAMGKAAVAAGSAVLLFSSLSGTSSAGAPVRPADEPICTAVGGALAPVGQICTSVVGALPLPDVPVALPTTDAAASGSALPALPGLADLGSILPTGDAGGLPGLGGLLPAAAPAPGVGGGSAAPALPVAPALPGLTALPAAIATVITNGDPIIGTLHDSLPTDALPLGTLPVGTVVGALTPVTGALDTVGGIVTTSLPITKPIIDPVLATVNALPGQVAGLLNTLVNGQPVRVPTAAPVPSAATLPAAVASSAVAPKIENATGLDRPADNVAAALAAAPAGAAAPAAAQAPKAAASPASGGGESLPITGIGVTVIGLAGAAALGWGAFARSIAARKRVAAGS